MTFAPWKVGAALDWIRWKSIDYTSRRSEYNHLREKEKKRRVVVEVGLESLKSEIERLITNNDFTYVWITVLKRLV